MLACSRQRRVNKLGRYGALRAARGLRKPNDLCFLRVRLRSGDALAIAPPDPCSADGDAFRHVLETVLRCSA
jgi:hypothetical protein